MQLDGDHPVSRANQPLGDHPTTGTNVEHGLAGIDVGEDQETVSPPAIEFVKAPPTP